ncbi:uncharacterized protein HKW66_Vig0205940 [Vigna angularis]|uniref:Uncharacterized protein n=1 Tax=Phaseolus angularis TaxID=3914 RepID=A0A8T0JIN3_PHAAN|nr:uncharacterized protein HKW66_Vig0205940 [Vigna angularis]
MVLPEARLQLRYGSDFGNLIKTGETEKHWMSEAPFRPREKLFEKQKYFQNIPKHTYLKGPMDKVTSVAIPLALAASSLYLITSSTAFLIGRYAFQVLLYASRYCSLSRSSYRAQIFNAADQNSDTKKFMDGQNPKTRAQQLTTKLETNFLVGGLWGI